MARLALALLGSPQIALDDAPVRFDTRKLAALLWPEYADARNALRRTLSTLQNGLGQGWLTVDRDQVAPVSHPDLWLDVSAQLVAFSFPSVTLAVTISVRAAR